MWPSSCVLNFQFWTRINNSISWKKRARALTGYCIFKNVENSTRARWDLILRPYWLVPFVYKCFCHFGKRRRPDIYGDSVSNFRCMVSAGDSLQSNRYIRHGIRSGGGGHVGGFFLFTTEDSLALEADSLNPVKIGSHFGWSTLKKQIVYYLWIPVILGLVQFLKNICFFPLSIIILRNNMK